MVKVVAGLECSRCGGASILVLQPERGLDKSQIRACPHCFVPGIEREYTVGRMYYVTDILPTTGFVEESDGIESVQQDCGELSEIEWEDYYAVKCDGKGYAERARERGVARAVIWSSVQRAIAKFDEIGASQE